MAAQLLEEKLTCAICLVLYGDPVTLPCGHNFCKGCIQDWRRREKECPECPECREPFPDRAELRRNVTLSGVLEVLRAAPPEADAEPGARRPRCPRHGRPLELFCRTEGRCVCSACTAHQCRDHERALLDAERRAREAQLRARLEVTERQATEVETQLQELQQRSLEIQVQGLPVAHPATPPTVPRTPRSREGGALSQVPEDEVSGTLAAPSPPLSPVGSPGPGHAEASPGPAQSSACTLSSVASSKFSCLMEALEMQRTLALRGIQAAETQALAHAREEEQRLQDHLDALARDGDRIRALLEQGDDQTFLQESQQLPEPPQPAGPLTLPQWDEDQQLGPLKELLSPLCDLLLQGDSHPRAPAQAADLGPVEAPGPQAPVGSTLCPLRRRLWQNYRNLTFDAGSANRHLYLSRQNQQVQHRRQPRGPAGPGSFELWQVQCAQSFRSGHHYWEVRASEHSVTLGVAYPELARCRLGAQTDNIGRGPSSWGLCVQEDSVQAWHDGEASRHPGVSGRLLGVDLDLASGSLTFYSLEPETRPLHTFHALFTRPLCPVFWLLEGRTLTLCRWPGATVPREPQEEASVPS